MGWIQNDHADRFALLEHAGTALERACRAAIQRDGEAFLALAGGQTPLPLYAWLGAIDWAGRVLAVPTDDRCVPHAHPASNVGQLQATLGGNPQASVLALTSPEGGADDSLALARAAMAAHPQPFDLVLLGMGADGHFASLFAGAAGIEEALAPTTGTDVVAITPHPLPASAPWPRISLTLSRLLRAREIHLLATGEDKRAVLDACRASASAPYPLAALLHADALAPIHIHWSP